MAGVKLIDRVSNVILRNKTNVRDVNYVASQRKWNWASKIANYPNDRWPKLIAEWQPDGKRKAGRPRKRWRDDFVQQYGDDYLIVAQDKRRIHEWRQGFKLHVL